MNSVKDSMPNSKIGYIYQDQYPWDIRAEKICSTLRDAGHEVHLISRNRSALPVMEKVTERFYIHRLPKGIGAPMRELVNFPAFFSPFWIWTINKIVKRNSLDLIIVRDLPLALAAYFAGKLTNRPVLLDMAENYPALIRSTWEYRGPKFIDYFIRNPYLLEKLEKFSLPLMDGVFVVSELSARRVKIIRNNRGYIWVVGNTPAKKDLMKRDIDWVNNIKKNSGMILLYTGMIESHRGLQTPIEGVSKIVEKVPNVHLIIVGKGTYEKQLKKLVKDLKIERNVTFAGWMPHEDIASIISAADICLIPHYVTEHTNTTLPNKIFDYMAQAKPILSTQSQALSEIIKNTECGLIYEDKSTDNFCWSFLEMMDSNCRKTLGENGRNAYREKYNWEIDRQILLNAVDNFKSNSCDAINRYLVSS